MQYITIFDYLLLPVYLYIFYIIVKKQSVKYDDAALRKFFITAFFLRMTGSVLYSLVVQYYYGYGDTFTYYVGGNFIIEQIQNNFSDISLLFATPQELQKLYAFQQGTVGGVNGFIEIPSAVAMMKLSVLISVLTFNKFLISSIFLGFFAFAGQWKLFMVFNDINKKKDQKLLAWGVLYFPSIWFWGSGLIKESVCLGALGFIISILYTLFVKKKFSIKNIIVLIFMTYIVWIIKSYIIVILAIGLSTIVFFNVVSGIKIFLVKAFFILVFLFIGITLSFVLNFTDQIQILAHESKVQVDTFQRNYKYTQEETESSQGGLAGAEIDDSVLGIILHMPAAIFTCLYRPFLWESRKIFIFFSALESTLLLLITVYLFYKMKFFGFFKEFFNDPYNFGSLVISILFALIIGFTTYNFGTIARYRIVLLPFYFFVFVRMHSSVKDKKINS